jgi:hypothetical protein
MAEQIDISLVERQRCAMEFCGNGCVHRDWWNPIRTSAIQTRSRPMRFLGFSNHEKGAPRQEISKWSTVCSTFSRSGWSVVRTASLAKGGTSKKRLSPRPHKVPTRSNKVSPQTFQAALVPDENSIPRSSSLYHHFLYYTVLHHSLRFIQYLISQENIRAVQMFHLQNYLEDFDGIWYRRSEKGLQWI